MSLRKCKVWHCHEQVDRMFCDRHWRMVPVVTQKNLVKAVDEKRKNPKLVLSVQMALTQALVAIDEAEEAAAQEVKP